MLTETTTLLSGLSSSRVAVKRGKKIQQKSKVKLCTLEVRTDRGKNCVPCPLTHSRRAAYRYTANRRVSIGGMS